MLSMASQKMKISYPIFLVISGLLIGMSPKGLHISLDPDLVFIIFLPPLLFEAAWNSSFSQLLKFKRSIGRLSLGLVFFTSLTVALVAHYFIPGFGLALGFVLGGIISPPDAVAATSVLNGLKVPSKVKAILEGESLINDASSLVVFRFALAAVLTGQFVFWKAGASFLWISGMGIFVGLAIAVIVYFFLRFLPTTPSIDTTITFIFPYLAYLTAEHFDASGVLAVVSGGLLLNSKSNIMLSYNSRLQMGSVWDMMVFLMNGVIFMMIGLQLPDIIDGLGEYSLKEAIGYGLLISITAILVRFFWVFPLTSFSEKVRSKFGQKYTQPFSTDWKSYFIIGWSGMRGVVSLASALYIPFKMANGDDFPHRNLILFITFVVIFVTLVVQGLLLPFIIKWLHIEVNENTQASIGTINVIIAEQVLTFMHENYEKECENNASFIRIRDFYNQMLEDNEERPVVTEGAKRESSRSKFNQFLLEIIDLKRKCLTKLRLEHTYPEYIIRNKENELDLEEARLRQIKH